MAVLPLQIRNLFFLYLMLFPGYFGQAEEDVEDKLPEICPPLQLYHNETGRCYRWGTRGPCKELTYFYQRNPQDYRQGGCSCQRMEFQDCKVARPTVLWQETSQCFYLFDQGPCKENQWLVKDDSYRTVCENIPCPQEFARFAQKHAADEAGETKFLFSFEGKCYETLTEGYPPCGPGKTVFPEVRSWYFEFVCSSDGQDGVCSPKFPYLLLSKPLPCSEGFMRDGYGECIPQGGFEET